ATASVVIYKFRSFLEWDFQLCIEYKLLVFLTSHIGRPTSALGTKATLRYSIWSSASIILHNGQKRTFASLRHSIQMAPYTPKMSTFLGELGHITSCSAEI